MHTHARAIEWFASDTAESDAWLLDESSSFATADTQVRSSEGPLNYHFCCSGDFDVAVNMSLPKLLIHKPDYWRKWLITCRWQSGSYSFPGFYTWCTESFSFPNNYRYLYRTKMRQFLDKDGSFCCDLNTSRYGGGEWIPTTYGF